MDSTSLYEHLNNLGFSGDDLLKVEAGILEAEATLTRLLHSHGGGDFHAYLDPLFGVFASLFSERNWDESVEQTVLELVSDALIERVQTVLPPGGPERTETFCERYGSFWVPGWFPAHLKRELAVPIKQWHARAIRASCSRVREAKPENPKKRGRPTRFTRQQLRTAYEMKDAGEKNNEIAKVLYKTNTPTPEQRRSVPTELNYHSRSKK